jgi:hypothetical protein
VLQYYFRYENIGHWEEIQKLVTQPDTPAADRTLRQYVLEANRLTSMECTVRVCARPVTVDGHDFKPGEVIVNHLVRLPRLPYSIYD